jgi:hypothetical protein
LSTGPGWHDGDGGPTEDSLPSAEDLFSVGPVVTPEQAADEVRRSAGLRHAPRPDQRRDGPDTAGLLRWLGLE